MRALSQRAQRVIQKLQADHDRMKKALAAYCLRCPNCDGKGWQLRIGIAGIQHREKIPCQACRWAKEALPEETDAGEKR